MKPVGRWTLWRAIGWAVAGIAHAWRTQPNMRIHGAISVGVVAMAGWLGVDARDWAILALTIGVVVAAELVNTALEAAVDLASPAPHALAKVAKDAAAGAVLVLAVAAVAVGLLVLGPPLWGRLVAAR